MAQIGDSIRPQIVRNQQVSASEQLLENVRSASSPINPVSTFKVAALGALLGSGLIGYGLGMVYTGENACLGITRLVRYRDPQSILGFRFGLLVDNSRCEPIQQAGYIIAGMGGLLLLISAYATVVAAKFSWFSQNQVSQNQVSQNQVSQNQVSQNQVSQNQVLSNQVSQNQVTSNQVPLNQDGV